MSAKLNDTAAAKTPPRAIVWTIAGSDSGGGAGIQADLHSIQALGGYGCSVVSCITAQNSQTVSAVAAVSAAMLQAQLAALAADLPPLAIKIGLLVNSEQVAIVGQWLTTLKQQAEQQGRRKPWVVYDPVMRSSTEIEMAQQPLWPAIKQQLLPHVDVLTPNRQELALALGREATDIMADAEQIRRALPDTALLLTGGDSTGDYCDDVLLSDDNAQFGAKALRYRSPRIATHNNHGTGCCLSSALATALALDYPLLDAVMIAKAYVNQGLERACAYGAGAGPVAVSQWPEQARYFPALIVSNDAEHARSQLASQFQFRSCQQPLALYPVVPDCRWLERLLQLGVSTIQLRCKHLKGGALSREIQHAVRLGQQYQAQLFINDHWQLAIKHQAYGVHLGQQDLQNVDLEQIHRAGLRLGISSHGYAEMQIARQLRPSYIALGHIFATKTKIMPSKPQGLERLQRYVTFCAPHNTVAIGGIKLDNAEQVWQTGVDALAVVSAITEADDYPAVVAALQRIVAILHVAHQHSEDSYQQAPMRHGHSEWRGRL